LSPNIYLPNNKTTQKTKLKTKNQTKDKDKNHEFINETESVSFISFHFWFWNEMKCLKMALLNLPRFFSTLSPSPIFSIHPHRPFKPLTFSSTSLRPLRCRAAAPDPPPPHNSDPPPVKDSTQLQSKFFNSILYVSFIFNFILFICLYASICYETRTLLVLDMSWCWTRDVSDTDTCDCTELCHFFKLLSVPMCWC
jgi:hypothetical protein